MYKQIITTGLLGLFLCVASAAEGLEPNKVKIQVSEDLNITTIEIYTLDPNKYKIKIVKKDRNRLIIEIVKRIKKAPKVLNPKYVKKLLEIDYEVRQHRIDRFENMRKEKQRRKNKNKKYDIFNPGYIFRTYRIPHKCNNPCYQKKDKIITRLVRI